MSHRDAAMTAEPGPDLHTLVVGRDAMACRFELVFNAGEVPEATELSLEALDLVDAIESRITVYRDSSELARINAGAAAGWQPVAPDLFELLLHARDLHDRTGGAFDIAAGSLVRGWGFLRRQGRMPSDEQLARARETAGMRWVELDPAGRRVRFTRDGVELNLGAIGKGWALDRVVELLQARGVASVLVHGGSSSVKAVGIQGPDVPGRSGWRVGLRHPSRPDRRLATITLHDRALGTSGSGTQFFIDRGRKLGHILDPRTGVPAEGVLSATVVASSAADADALATALYVLGPPGLQRLSTVRTDAAETRSGDAIGAVLVLPGRTAGSVRVLTANLDAGTLAIDGGEGVEVVRVL